MYTRIPGPCIDIRRSAYCCLYRYDIVNIMSRSSSASGLDLISNSAMQLCFVFWGASESGGSKVFKAAHLSPSISLQNSFYIKLKWIPSLTSPPLKFPLIKTVEVQAAMLTALLRNPHPLRPLPTWTAEAPVAMLTALLPKWRIRVNILS